jgi:hypothetical protein
MPNNVVYVVLPQCKSIAWFPIFFTNLIFVDFFPLILHHYLDFYLIFLEEFFFSNIFYKSSFSITISFIKTSHTFSFSKVQFSQENATWWRDSKILQAFTSKMINQIVNICKTKSSYFSSFTIVQNYKVHNTNLEQMKKKKKENFLFPH